MTEATKRRPDSPPEGRPSAVGAGPAALFTAWHRLLTRVAWAFVHLARRCRAIGTAWSSQWMRLRDYHATSTGPWQPADARARETAAALGVRAFAFGLVLAGWAAMSARNAWIPGVAIVLTEVLWAAARYVIIALLMPKGAVGRAQLSTAYLAGLIPYVLGATAALRVVSLVASGYLTRRGLLGAGVTRRDADRAIGWSFGGQAAVFAAGWLLKAVVALVASL